MSMSIKTTYIKLQQRNNITLEDENNGKTYLLFFMPHVQNPVTVFQAETNDTQKINNIIHKHRVVTNSAPILDTNNTDNAIVRVTSHYNNWKADVFKLSIKTTASSNTKSGYLEIIDLPLHSKYYGPVAVPPGQPDPGVTETTFYDNTLNGNEPTPNYANYVLYKMDWQKMNSYRLINFYNSGSFSTELKRKNTSEFRLIKPYYEFTTITNKIIDLSDIFEDYFDHYHQTKCIKLTFLGPHQVLLSINNKLLLTPKPDDDSNIFAKSIQY